MEAEQLRLGAIIIHRTLKNAEIGRSMSLSAAQVEALAKLLRTAQGQNLLLDPDGELDAGRKGGAA